MCAPINLITRMHLGKQIFCVEKLKTIRLLKLKLTIFIWWLLGRWKMLYIFKRNTKPTTKVTYIFAFQCFHLEIFYVVHCVPSYNFRKIYKKNIWIAFSQTSSLVTQQYITQKFKSVHEEYQKSIPNLLTRMKFENKKNKYTVWVRVYIFC